MQGKMGGIVTGLLLVGICFGGEDGVHVFTDQQNRVVSAKIINVDDLRGLVELELDGGRRVKVKPSAFTEKDQAYIRDWNTVQTFLSSSGFKLELKKKVVETWSEKGDVQRDFEKVLFEIVMTNRGKAPLENLQVAYNVFYEQEQLNSGGQYTEKECGMDWISHPRIEPLASATLATQPVVVFNQHLSFGYDGYVDGFPDRQEGDIKGVWVRVFLSTSSGLSAVREFKSPENLNNHCVWKEPIKSESVPEAGKGKKHNK
ncbi:MAG: hypothetical protein K9M54_09415 [Kiritimatiellales bacterium]|nr:hypothetical protein [Kiritimatiellales bacterium]MCF7863422.1 hypothetical protein [Kiritimatiellales bacterium]